MDNKYTKIEKATSDGNTRYYKLPFIGRFSELTKKKIQHIAKKYCQTASIKLVFNSYKIGQTFSTKDSIPLSLKSHVVYKFDCANCNASYIGETTRHLFTRCEEHLKKDKQSHIYKHLHGNIDCFNKCDNNCFSVLDTASTNYQLKLKEGMYIGWEKPELNKQVKYLSASLSV